MNEEKKSVEPVFIPLEPVAKALQKSPGELRIWTGITLSADKESIEVRGLLDKLLGAMRQGEQEMAVGTRSDLPVAGPRPVVRVASWQAPKAAVDLLIAALPQTEQSDYLGKFEAIPKPPVAALQ